MMISMEFIWFIKSYSRAICWQQKIFLNPKVSSNSLVKAAQSLIPITSENQDKQYLKHLDIFPILDGCVDAK